MAKRYGLFDRKRAELIRVTVGQLNVNKGESKEQKETFREIRRRITRGLADAFKWEGPRDEAICRIIAHYEAVHYLPLHEPVPDTCGDWLNETMDY